MSLLRYGPTDRTHSNRATLFGLGLLILAVTLLLARNIELASGVLISLALAAMSLWLVIRLIIAMMHKFIPPRPYPWFVALKTITSNGGRSAWLISAFSMTIFALALLGIIRTDIFYAWQQGVPDDAPNLFMMNIKPDDRVSLDDLLSRNEIPDTEFFMIIRGRIVEINGLPAIEAKPSSSSDEANDSDQEKSRRERLRHEFNITETVTLPKDNHIVQGKWFDEGASGFSIEQDIAERLSLDIGDTLTISVAGGSYQGIISSIRSVKWDNMRPNFYLIAAPDLFVNAPRNFMAGVHVQQNIDELSQQINNSLPGVIAIDLNMILDRFRELVSQGGQAITVVLLFTLCATLLVLVGILQGQRDARRKEIALFKTMGANGRFVAGCILWEFSLLGLLSGLIGGGLSLLSAWALADKVFELPLELNPIWLFYCIGAGVFLVSLTGFMSTRRLLSVVPTRLFSGL